MKKMISLALFCILFTTFIFAETIILKSGKEIRGKLIEKTKDYITVDYHEVPVTFFFDEISEIKETEQSPTIPQSPTATNNTIWTPETLRSLYSQIKETLITQLGDSKSSLNAIEILAYFLITIVMIVSWWKIFSICGYPGWSCLIPLYNQYVMIKIAEKPGWWLLLFFVPLVNIVVFFNIHINIARNLGRSTGFGIGLSIAPFIFYPLLAISNDRKKDRKAEIQESSLQEPTYRP